VNRQGTHYEAQCQSVAICSCVSARATLARTDQALQLYFDPVFSGSPRFRPTPGTQMVSAIVSWRTSGFKLKFLQAKSEFSLVFKRLA